MSCKVQISPMRFADDSLVIAFESTVLVVKSKCIVELNCIAIVKQCQLKEDCVCGEVRVKCKSKEFVLLKAM